MAEEKDYYLANENDVKLYIFKTKEDILLWTKSYIADTQISQDIYGKWFFYDEKSLDGSPNLIMFEKDGQKVPDKWLFLSKEKWILTDEQYQKLDSDIKAGKNSPEEVRKYLTETKAFNKLPPSYRLGRKEIDEMLTQWYNATKKINDTTDKEQIPQGYLDYYTEQSNLPDPSSIPSIFNTQQYYGLGYSIIELQKQTKATLLDKEKMYLDWLQLAFSAQFADIKSKSQSKNKIEEAKETQIAEISKDTAIEIWDKITRKEATQQEQDNFYAHLLNLIVNEGANYEFKWLSPDTKTDPTKNVVSAWKKHLVKKRDSKKITSEEEEILNAFSKYGF